MERQNRCPHLINYKKAEEKMLRSRNKDDILILLTTVYMNLGIISSLFFNPEEPIFCGIDRNHPLCQPRLIEEAKKQRITHLQIIGPPQEQGTDYESCKTRAAFRAQNN